MANDTVCEHHEGCTMVGFSKSVEHEDIWLCAKHYNKFLVAKQQMKETLATFNEIMSDPHKAKKLMQLLTER